MIYWKLSDLLFKSVKKPAF